jgi:bifunctional DNase/RNase
MKRKQLKVMGLSYSQSQIGSYVVVLGEKKGNKKLPVIIKPNDAQNIAVKLEHINTARPLTHDLLKSVTDSFQIDVYEIFIYGLIEGMFYAKAMTSNGLEEVGIECSIGDAIAISLVYKCPIWINVDILDQAGINLNDDGSDLESIEIEDDFEEEDDVDSKTSVDDLEKLMAGAIANEEYEIAAEIRDRISRLKGEGQE